MLWSNIYAKLLVILLSKQHDKCALSFVLCMLQYNVNESKQYRISDQIHTFLSNIAEFWTFFTVVKTDTKFISKVWQWEKIIPKQKGNIF